MNVDIEQHAEMIQRELHLLVTHVVDCEEENAKLRERLPQIDQLASRLALAEVLLERSEDQLREAREILGSEWARDLDAEAKAAAIRAAAENVARFYDDGSFDIIAGEEAFAAIDQLIATLGVES